MTMDDDSFVLDWLRFGYGTLGCETTEKCFAVQQRPNQPSLGHVRQHSPLEEAKEPFGNEWRLPSFYRRDTMYGVGLRKLQVFLTYFGRGGGASAVAPGHSH